MREREWKHLEAQQKPVPSLFPHVLRSSHTGDETDTEQCGMHRNEGAPTLQARASSADTNARPGRLPPQQCAAFPKGLAETHPL